jgi:hypothetical protein
MERDVADRIAATGGSTPSKQEIVGVLNYARNVIEQRKPSRAKVGVIEPDTDLKL